MEFLIFALIWWLIGSLGCLFLHFRYDEEVNIGNLFVSFYAGVIGPLGILLTIAILYGDKVLYRKK